MKQPATRARAEQNAHAVQPVSSAGPGGAAVAPPAYGIELADRAAAAGGERLPHLETIQPLFGRHDVTGVKASTGEGATRAAHAMGARAFTTGSAVTFAGTPTLHTAAHEATHVIQQAAGVQLPGRVGAVGDRYERHADEVAALVVRGSSAEALLDRFAAPAGGPSDGVVQLAWVPLATPNGRTFVALARELADHPDRLAQAKVAEQGVDRVAETNPVVITLLDLVRNAAAIGAPEQATLTTRTAKIRANEVEHAEAEHSIARHGPELSDDQLRARLFTGVAPDHKLSPAPGSSSRFLDYDLLLETRQAAATVLTNDIAACQAAARLWVLNVLPNLAAVKAQKDVAHGQATADRNQREAALALHRANLLSPASDALAAIDAEIAAKREERDTLQDEIRTGMTVGTIFDPGEPIDAAGIGERQTRLPDVVNELAQLALQRQAPSATVAQHTATDTGLEAARNVSALTLNTAVTEQATATEELANPGKSLEKRLRALRTLQLEIDPKAGGTVTVENGVNLLTQYNVIVDHGRDVGSGFENINAADVVSLTTVLAVATADVTTDPLVPFAQGVIEAGLVGLGLRIDMAPFLTDANNLKQVKAKGAAGASVYKRAQASAALQQTLTNFECRTRKLFDHASAPIPIVAAGWKAIQHFPTSGEAAGVKEHYR